jgi:hypothetical protein
MYLVTKDLDPQIRIAAHWAAIRSLYPLYRVEGGERDIWQRAIFPSESIVYGGMKGFRGLTRFRKIFVFAQEWHW